MSTNNTINQQAQGNNQPQTPQNPAGGSPKTEALPQTQVPSPTQASLQTQPHDQVYAEQSPVYGIGVEEEEAETILDRSTFPHA